jgi:hypothetical protein
MFFYFVIVNRLLEMGASSSSSTMRVDELNYTDIGVDNSTFNEIKNTCESAQSQSNVLNIIGSDVTKLNVDQKNLLKNMCMLKTAIERSVNTESESKIAAMLKTQVEANAVAGIGVGVANTNTDITRRNIVNTKIDNRTFNKVMMGCLGDQKQENVINIVGSKVTDSTLSQANEAIIDCISDYGNKDTIVQRAAATTESTTESTAKATAEGMDPMKLLMMSLLPCIIIVVIIVVSSMVGGMGGGGGSGGGEGGGGGGVDVGALASMAAKFKGGGRR